MSGSIFSFNHGMGLAWNASPEGRDALLEIAGQVAERAKELAPVKTGEYRDSIEARLEGDRVLVVADDRKAGWIEFGTGGGNGHHPTQAFAPLRTAAEEAGLKFKARRVK